MADIQGTNVRNYLNGTPQDDRIWGYGGDDSIYGNSGNDLLYGGSGYDNMYGGPQNDEMWGEDDNDYMDGQDGNDTLHGGAGDDYLIGGTRVDALYGDAGDDLLMGGTTDEGLTDTVLDGGDGIDNAIVLKGSSAGPLVYSVKDAETLVDGTIIRAMEAVQFYAGSGDDHITGGDYRDDLYGGNGDDVLIGGAGDDLLDGETGADSLYGGDGNDTLSAGLGADLIVDGGDGVDIAAVGRSDSDAPLVFSFAGMPQTYTVDGTTLIDVERIFLGAGRGDDDLTGGDLADRLYGNLGDDRLDGGRGADELRGADGNDRLYSLDYGDGTRDTVVDGGLGTDFARIDLSASTAALTFSIANPNVEMIVDGLSVIGIEQVDVTAGSGDDSLTGGALADVLEGGAGADTLAGGAGDDTLRGGDGDDLLDGGAGDDLIEGGNGTDTLRLDGARADYAIAQVSGYIEIRDLRGTAVDRLAGVEYVAFADVTLPTTGLSAPTGITLDAQTVRENAFAGTIVGTARAIDADLIDSFTFTLVDDAGGRFAIGAATGTITVADPAGLDFESAASHDIMVEVRDSAGATYQQVFTIGVADIANDRTATVTAGSFTAPTAENWTVTGGTGVDTIATAGGADAVLGAGGDDAIVTGDGDDVIAYLGAANGFDAVDGGAGDDRLLALRDGTVIGLTALSGVEAIDADGHAGVAVAGSGRSDVLDLAAVTLTGVARIDTGAGNDTLTGSAGADTIAGGAGNDLLRGGGGDDVFLFATGHGTDRIDGGAGQDTLRAEADGTVIGAQWIAGIEAIDAGGHADVTVAFTGGNDSASFEQIALTGIASIDLGAGNDRFRGSAGTDRVDGGAGDDLLIGGAGDDVLLGGDGADVFEIAYGAGIDTIDGGDGVDTIAVTTGTFT